MYQRSQDNVVASLRPHYPHEDGGNKQREAKKVDDEMAADDPKKVIKEKDSDSEKEVDTVIFIPITPEGRLKRHLQIEDDKFAKTMGLKQVRFVETHIPGWLQDSKTLIYYH